MEGGGAGWEDLETACGGVLFWRADPAGRWTWSCSQWSSFTGLSPAASRGDGWLEAVHPEDRPAAIAPWPDRDDGGCGRTSLRIRQSRGGAYGRMQPIAAPARASGGALTEWVGTFNALAPERDDHQARTGELQHRMRNVLAVIRSVARRTARTSGTVEHYATHFEGRLDALARVQDAVTRSSGRGVDLDGLIGEELVAHRVGDANVSISGPPLRLTARAADALGLALHELVTNSVKFGALTAPGGAVAIRWTVDDAAVPPTLLLTWHETGIVAASLAPRRRGFGTETIERSLPYELNAATRFGFGPGELRCTVALPLTTEIALP